MLVLEAASLLGPGRSYTVHVQDTAGMWSFPEHTHRGFCDLAVVERGRVHQRLNGQDIVLGAGEAVLVRESDRHGLRGSDVRFHNLNIPVAEWERLAAYAGSDLPLHRLWSARTPPRALLPVVDRQRILADLAELIASQHGQGSRAVLARFLLRWLPAFDGHTLRAPAGRAPGWLDPLLRRIEDGIGQGLSVTALPGLAGVSQAHLSRSFRRHLGLSPSQHLNRIRLQRAALELARTDRPVLEIGYGLGFSSASYFYRLFVRAYALPPASYRARHRMPR